MCPPFKLRIRRSKVNSARVKRKDFSGQFHKICGWGKTSPAQAVKYHGPRIHSPFQSRAFDLPTAMRSLHFLRPVFGAVLCGALLFPALCRADAFAPIPPNDPIYRQLNALTLLGEGKTAQPTEGLTRYEAALQVARVAAIASTKPEALGRTGWRALRDATTSLKPELRQLGVDVNDVLLMCARRLDASGKTDDFSARPNRSKNHPGGLLSVPPTPSFLNGSSSPADSRAMQSVLALSPFSSGRVRVEAALLAMQRDELAPDPFADGNSSLLSRARNTTQFVGNDTSLALDVNPWLRVAAQTSQRRLGLGDRSPALSAPLFQGATKASGVGGSVEVSPLNGVRLTTDVEQLSTNTGTTGLRVGGGIGLSAWQNRLTLSAHLSRLQSQDRAFVPSTATELNLGAALSDRLSLRLLYQGLFSQQSESSRLAGGLNFSF